MSKSPMQLQRHGLQEILDAMPLPFVIPPGTQIYKYSLTSRIGGGGFGDVWLATDGTINRTVAVKILDASSVTINDHLGEARIGNQLNHQNLVKIHYADVTTFNSTRMVFIVMDHHQNGSVLGKLNPGNFLPLPQAKDCLIDLLRGLEYLHELGIYHGDIKPNNILCGSSGEHLLTDYGISCHSPTLAPVAPRNAYRLHIAPEILTLGQIDTLTDIYQVGLTAFRLLNGIGILEAKYNQYGDGHYVNLVNNGKLITPTDYQLFIPRAIKAIVNKAISLDPADRYQSALEMRRALEGVAFPGHWTCTNTGQLQGHNTEYTYHFDEIALQRSLFNFTAFKTNKNSGRTTKVSDYSEIRVKKSRVAELKKKFINFVVTGRA